MKITELRCSACSGTLKIDEDNPNVAECEYCHSRYTIESDNAGKADEIPYLKPMQEQMPYGQPYFGNVPRANPKSNAAPRILSIVLACLGALAVWLRIFGIFGSGGSSQSDMTSGGGGIGIPAAAEENSAGGSETEAELTGVLADFVKVVYGKPAEEVTEGELAKIQWLELKSGIEYREVGYSFENPFENPEAELIWVRLPADDYSGYELEGLPAFTGVKMLKTGQSLREEHLIGLTLWGIGGYFDSLEQVAELTERPEEMRRIEISGNPVSLAGIDRFPNLETLLIDSDEIAEEKLLVSAASLKAVSVDIYDGSMDFATFGMMPWLEELTICSGAVRDIGFVSKMEHLKALHLEDGAFLTLDPLREVPGLEELSIEDCDELKEMSAVSALTGLKKLSLDLPYDCAQPDLSPLTAVEELCLRNFDDTGDLRYMSGLAELTLDGGTAGAASDFAGLTNLKTLRCTSFGYTEHDYGFVTSLPALENLDLHGTVTYGDISGIFNMPTLKSLNISGMECEIAFDRIAENTTLEELSIDNIKLYKNVSVSGGGGFYSVDWDDVILTENLDFLCRLKGLKQLSICENELTEIEFAASLQALQRIDFSDNYVTDLSPLSGLKDLRQVVSGENPVSNDEVLGESVVVVR